MTTKKAPLGGLIAVINYFASIGTNASILPNYEEKRNCHLSNYL